MCVDFSWGPQLHWWMGIQTGKTENDRACKMVHDRYAWPWPCSSMGIGTLTLLLGLGAVGE